MSLSELEIEQLRTIISKVVAQDQLWLDEQRINVATKGDYQLLNYYPGKRTEYNRLTRALVIKKAPPDFSGDPLTLIASLPFLRFFNHGEAEADSVDLYNSEMLEKLDGTFVGVFFPHGDPARPELHTKKMISTSVDDMGMVCQGFYNAEFKLLEIIKNYVDQLKFSQEDVHFTYTFEFVHNLARVITTYEPKDYGLYLIGARNLCTYQELPEHELDDLSVRFQSLRGQRFDSQLNYDNIQQKFDEMNQRVKDFEGFIFRDKSTGKRIKVKDPRYVRKHHMLGKLSYHNLISVYLNKEENEVAAHFPIAGLRLKEIETKYLDRINTIFEKIKFWRAKKLDGKQLAIELLGMLPLSKWEIRLRKMRGESLPNPSADFSDNMVLQMHKEQDDAKILTHIEQELRIIALGQGTNLGSPKALVELLGLKNDEDNESVEEN